MLEHGAYTLLLDRYYTTEKPIADRTEAHRVCRARSLAEKAAVDTVLAEFFISDGKFFRNGRAEEEIAKAAHQRAINQELGKKGGRPRKTESVNEPKTESVTNRNPSQTPDTRLQETEEEPHVLGQAEDAPPDLLGKSPAATREARLAEVTRDAVETYNEAPFTKRRGGDCPNVALVSGEMPRRSVRRCIKVAAAICERVFGSPRITREFWQRYWESVDADPFHSGRTKPGNGHASWTPDFEFLTRPDVMTKIFDRAMSEAEEVEHVNP